MRFKMVSIYFIFVFLFNTVCAELRSAKSYKRIEQTKYENFTAHLYKVVVPAQVANDTA
jgi:hypothetical protein